MDPRTHQRDVGEKEHYPPQPSREKDPEQVEARVRSEQKEDQHNKNRHDQTAQARVAARQRREAAEKER